ncbi:MAG: hypothetical protein HY826_14510 [Actinobacteria bacterium]|nr:hypothetical protein [Actinomycetota bacterium]
MRQIFTWRFLLTLVALAGLVGVARLVVVQTGDDGDAAEVGSEPSGRRVDFVSWVESIQLPADFAIVSGRTTTDLYLVIDATRTMLVKAGTPGEVDCPRIAEPAQCVVAADLLGDGVLWFSVIPGSPGATVQLPAVVEIIGGGWVRLANDWIVQHAPKVERSCSDETSSLTDFIKSFGDEATASYNVEQQRVVKVTCPRASSTSTSTTSTNPDTSPVTTTTVAG